MLDYKLRKNIIIVIIFLLLFFFITLASVSYKSPTIDEPGHLAKGYIYLKTGYMGIVSHPPLMHVVTAFPLLFMNLKLPADYEKYIIINDYVPLGQEIFYKANSNSDIVFFWSRIPVILVGALLGYYIYKWSSELYGKKAGVFLLLLYSFSPLVLGNAPLLMTDMVVACFGFISTYYLWRFLQKRDTLNLLLTGVTFGLAQVSKFTALFLIPIFFFLMLFSPSGFSVINIRRKMSMKHRLRELGALVYSFGIILFISLLIINIFYSFEGLLKPLDKRIIDDTSTFFDKEYFKPKSIAGSITSNQFLRNVISFSLNYGTSVLPYSYLKDLASIIRINDPAISISTGGYLMGQYLKEGQWYYFLLAFLIKTPIPLLVLIIIAIATIFNSKIDLKNELFILIPLLFFPFYFSFHKAIGGLRYLLPSFPFLFMFIGRIYNDKVINPKKGVIKPLEAIIILLLIWYIVEAIFIFPNYTAYFNELIGGPSNGYKYLQGADLDSGQDLPLLADYVTKSKIKELKLAYYGTPDPYYYLNFTCIACPLCPSWVLDKCPEQCNPMAGIIGVSASLLQNTPHIKNTTCFDWIKAYNPIEKVGYTIFIYNIVIH